MLERLKSQINILIADDDEDDCLLVGEALEKSLPTAISCFVGNGEELLHYLQQCKTTTHNAAVKTCPDLILLDLNMPRLDGREALKLIKKDEYLKSIPIVILSTSTNMDDVNLCYKLGANSYFTKPSSFDELARLMAILGSYWFSAVNLPDKDISFNDIKAMPELGTTILIVDDSFFTRNVLARILKQAGHNVIQAEDGETALNLYRNENPDLVMLDLALPQFSGSKVLENLQAIDPNVKVIITTSDFTHITKDHLVAKGVMGVLYKPLHSDATLGSVDSAIQNEAPGVTTPQIGTEDS
jgi:two-component system response regulator